MKRYIVVLLIRSCFFVYQLKSFSEIKSVKTLRHVKAELSLLIVIEIFLSVMQHCWPYCSIPLLVLPLPRFQSNPNNISDIACCRTLGRPTRSFVETSAPSPLLRYAPKSKQHHEMHTKRQTQSRNQFFGSRQ